VILALKKRFTVCQRTKTVARHEPCRYRLTDYTIAIKEFKSRHSPFLHLGRIVVCPQTLCAITGNPAQLFRKSGKGPILDEAKLVVIAVSRKCLFLREKYSSQEWISKPVVTVCNRNFFRRFSSIFGDFHRFSAIFGDFHRFSAIFINFRQFSSIFGNFHRLSTIFIDFRRKKWRFCLKNYAVCNPFLAIHT
jgi:hypothetical protein